MVRSLLRLDVQLNCELEANVVPILSPVPVLECTVAQPVCNGKKANAYEHAKSTTAVGEKRTPSNNATTSIDDSTTSSSSNSALDRAAPSTFALAASLVLAALVAQ